MTKDFKLMATIVGQFVYLGEKVFVVHDGTAWVPYKWDQTGSIQTIVEDSETAGGGHQEYTIAYSPSSYDSHDSTKHTVDDAKDWEDPLVGRSSPAPTPEDFHQLGHPPQCDCGAEKANTTHAQWCSIKEERL